MSNVLFLSTTGTLGTVVFNDLGARTFTHPTTSYQISPDEYRIEELRDSQDVLDALDAGYITLSTETGAILTTSIDLLQLGSGNMTLVEKTTAPTINDDAGDNFLIGNHWLNTTTGEAYVLTDATIGAAQWVKTTATNASEVTVTPSGNLSSTDVQNALQELQGDVDAKVFGNDYTYVASLTTTTTTSSTYISKALLTTPVLLAGDYRVAYSCEVNNSDEGGSVNTQLLQNGITQLAASVTEPKDVANYYMMSGFVKLSLMAGIHTFDLQFQQIGAGTASIRRAKVEIFRIS